MEEGEKVSETTSQVLSVGCSSFHVLRRTSGGLLSVFGLNAHSQLGRARSGGLLTHALEIGGPFKIKIMQIATGFNHTLFLLADATVFGCGGNQHGQLGFDGLERVDTPCQVQISSSNGIEQRIEQIACGTGFSVFLAEGGTVFFLGTLRGSEKRVWIPLPDPGKAVQIACGGHHYAIIMENGEMYVAGENAYGQHGYAVRTSEDDSPLVLFRVRIGERVTSIACGLFHTLALASSGKVYSFGMNLYGQLGHGGRRITGLARCVQYLSPEDGKVVGLAAGARSSTLYTENKILIFGEVFDLETLESSVYVEEPREIIESEASLMQSYLLILCPNKWSERELHVELERRGRYWRDAVVFGLAEYSSIGQPFWPMAIEDAKNLAMQDTVSLGVLPHAALKFVSTQRKYAPKHMSNVGIFLKNPSPNMPIALYREASGYYFRIKKLEKSIQMEKNVIKIASAGEMQDKIELATSHVFIGECEAKLGRREEAIRHLEVGIRYASDVKGGKEIVGTGSFHLAKIFDSKGYLEEAMQMYSKALENWDLDSLNTPLALKIYQAHFSRGISAVKLNRCGEAVPNLLSAMKIRESLTLEDFMTAVGHRLIGNCYVSLGKMEEAYDYFTRAYEISVKLRPNDSSLISSLHDRIGECLYKLRRIEEAVDHFFRSLEIKCSTEGEMGRSVAHNLTWIGRCFYYLREFVEALDYYQRALTLLRSDYSDGHSTIADRFYDVGKCLQKIEKYIDAVEIFTTAFGIYDKLSKSQRGYQCLSAIGVCLFSMKKFQEAIDWFHRAVKYHRRFITIDDESIADSLDEIGLCHFLLADFEQSLAVFKDSRDIHSSMSKESPTTLSRLGYNCGLCYYQLGRYWSSITEFKQALDIMNFNRLSLVDSAALHYALGSTYFAIRDFEASIGEFRKATSYWESDVELWRIPIAKSHMGIGACLLSQGSNFEAATHFENAQEILATENHGRGLIDICGWYIRHCFSDN